MTCIMCRSSVALFSRNSHVLMRSSLYGLSEAARKRDIRHACIGVIRLDYFLLGFGIRCFSAQEPHTSGISTENLKQPMEEESDAFYVVRKGDIIGIYKSLSDCQAQVSSSVCDPSVSVYKGYSLHKDSEDYLASRGFKDALYSMHAAHLKEDIFGTLVPCPFQQPDGLAFLNEKASKKSSKKRLKEVGVAGSGDVSLAPSNKLSNSVPAVEAQPISCKPVQDLWQTKNQNMAALCKEVKRLKEMFQSFNIIHVKRGFNAVADNLAYSAVTLPVGEVCEDCGPFN